MWQECCLQQMTLFNVRRDVEYYEFGVFDAEWNKVPFAMQNKIMKFKHLDKKDS